MMNKEKFIFFWACKIPRVCVWKCCQFTRSTMGCLKRVREGGGEVGFTTGKEDNPSELLTITHS